MKKLFESLFYLFLAALCVVGIGLGIEHINDKEDEVTETPATEEVDLQSVELVNNELNYSITINYVDGMTWTDWINSDYNTFDGKIELDQVVLTYNGGNPIVFVDAPVLPTDVIDNSLNYTLM